MRIPHFDKTYGAAVAEFHSSAILGNLLTHHNPIAESTSQQEVADFVRARKALHDIFFCGGCEELVKYFRDAKMVKCQCSDGGKE